VVRISPLITTTAKKSTVSWKRPGGASQHLVAPVSSVHRENNSQLLRSSSPDQKHLSVSLSIAASISRLFFGAVTVKLRMRNSGWATLSVTRQAPVSAKCSHPTDICEPSARPRDINAPQFTGYQHLQFPASRVSRRQQLRSSSMTALAIPCISHATLRSRAFAASATSAWNGISHNTIRHHHSSPSDHT